MRWGPVPSLLLLLLLAAAAAGRGAIQETSTSFLEVATEKLRGFRVGELIQVLPEDVQAEGGSAGHSFPIAGVYEVLQVFGGGNTAAPAKVIKTKSCGEEKCAQGWGDGMLFVFKAMEIAGGGRDAAMAEQELSCYRRLPIHPNILRLYGAFTKEDAVVMVLEFGGTPLNYYLPDSLPKHEAERKLVQLDLIDQLLSAVQILVDNRIIARDIKTDNLLVAVDGVAIPAEAPAADREEMARLIAEVDPVPRHVGDVAAACPADPRAVPLSRQLVAFCEGHKDHIDATSPLPRAAARPTLKLFDLGLAVQTDRLRSEGSAAYLDQRHPVGRYRGPTIRAPEIKRWSGPDPWAEFPLWSTDAWAAGVISLEIAMQRLLTKSDWTYSPNFAPLSLCGKKGNCDVINTYPGVSDVVKMEVVFDSKERFSPALARLALRKGDVLANSAFQKTRNLQDALYKCHEDVPTQDDERCSCSAICNNFNRLVVSWARDSTDADDDSEVSQLDRFAARWRLGQYLWHSTCDAVCRPLSERISMEGFMFKKTIHYRRKFVPRFFMLSGDQLLQYHEDPKDFFRKTPPRVLLQLTSKSTVEAVERQSLDYHEVEEFVNSLKTRPPKAAAVMPYSSHQQQESHSVYQSLVAGHPSSQADKRFYCFRVTEGDVTRYFCADTPKTRDNWVARISLAILPHE
eukprot:gnl/Hemi2/11211_TR3872_c0_g1_i1.p1 gnl/Hemi2/11211_TR3872_c0_g1~~gnl/Hemi2/11211_TR3872_c0_g1_i1.p1  ORF type:complete len:684 (+),score=154.05 gnl/Hemi2/11211_TR3872_c0_g1_i1:129-2180(+)